MTARKGAQAAGHHELTARRFGSLTGGLHKMVGFGLGMGLLGIATLLAIPAMVHVSGADAWAAIAIGQAVGGVAAVGIAYGWVVSGPASIAKANPADRRVEYVESVKTRLALFVPVMLVAAVVALLVTQTNPVLAVLGSISTAVIGLTASWFFVGTGEPYLLLALETVPRIAGTLIGILLMSTANSAAIGLISQIVGALVGFGLCSYHILRRHRGDGRLPTRSVRRVLYDQRHGVTSSAVSTLYAALPIVLVGWFAPNSLTSFAVLDKLQKQINSAVAPFVQVFQGWVPRAGRNELKHRVNVALVVAGAAGAVMAVVLTVIGQPLVRWLGGGQIQVSDLSLALAMIAISLSMIESIAAKACLVALGMIGKVARITTWGSLVGIIFIAAFAFAWGTSGAMAGLVLGWMLRLGVELVYIIRAEEAPAFPVIYVSHAEAKHAL